MTAPYVFTDQDGDFLTVAASRTGGVNLMVTEAKTRRRAAVTMPAWKLPDLVAALYRQAGETVPLLIHPDEVADDWVKVTRNGGAA